MSIAFSFNKTIQILVIFNLLIITHFSYGFQNQLSKDDSLELKKADWQFKRAFSLSYKSLNDSSKLYFDSCKISYKKYQQWKNLVNAYYYESFLLDKHQLLDSSITNYKKTIQIAKNQLSKENILTVIIINSLGKIYQEHNNLDKAEKQYLDGISFHKHIGDNPNFAFLYSNVANIYYQMFDFDKALEYLEKSYILKKKLKMQGVTIAKYHHIKGEILLEKKEFEKAKESLNSAVDIYKKSNIFPEQIECYKFLGNINSEIGAFDKARDHFNKSLKIAIDNKDKRFIAVRIPKIYIGIANSYLKQKRYKKALKYCHKGLQYAKDKNNAWVNLYLGKSHLALNQTDSALFYLQRGILDISFDFYNTDIYQNPLPENAKRNVRLLQLLQEKSLAFDQKFELANKSEIKNLKVSFQTSLVALDLIEIILKSNKSEMSKLFWGKLMTKSNEQTIKTALILYKITKEEKYLTTAFQVSEKSKAGILMSGLKNSEAKHFAGIPDELLQKEKEVKIDLSYYQSQLLREENKIKGQDSIKIFNYKEKIFALNRQQEDLTNTFETKYPKYHDFKYSNNEVNISELQNGLKENTTLIEYFVGDSSIYAFTVDKNVLEVKKLESIDTISNKILELQEALRKSNFTAFSELSNKLYQQLIQPLSLNKNLIIIPDGPLWYLNFDILLSQKPSRKDFKSCQYLIKDHNISYAYSAGLFMKDSESYYNSDNNDCLAFSYNNEDETDVGDYIAMRGFRNSKRDLPGTRKEISAISNVIEGAYYFGAFANEKNFKEQAKNYGILHLALHGEINDAQPMNSRLLFTQDKDSLEDNYLHAYELYNTELNAELAVLSACNTGSGRLVKGEGIMSMGRAFTYAGVKSLVLSQWELSDEFTPKLMENFYKNLKDGKSKSEALRNAKLAYLENADNLSANPYYWAPLVQLGDNSPLPKKSIWVWVAMGLVIVSVVFSTYSIIKKK